MRGLPQRPPFPFSVSHLGTRVYFIKKFKVFQFKIYFEPVTNTQFYLVSRLRMRRAIPPLPHVLMEWFLIKDRKMLPLLLLNNT
jgi:hypothetical protein